MFLPRSLWGFTGYRRLGTPTGSTLVDKPFVPLLGWSFISHSFALPFRQRGQPRIFYLSLLPLRFPSPSTSQLLALNCDLRYSLFNSFCPHLPSPWLQTEKRSVSQLKFSVRLKLLCYLYQTRSQRRSNHQRQASQPLSTSCTFYNQSFFRNETDSRQCMDWLKFERHSLQ